MNITQIAVENNRVTIILVVLLALYGIATYFSLPKAQDPGFIIRAAQVTTFLPGASPRRVEDLVTDRIEEAIQEIPEIDFISSQSRTGMSVVTANFQERYKDMRPLFDEMRRKIEDIESELPQDIAGAPIVNDDFGDVYGILYGLTGDGFSYAELEDIADEIKDELLSIDNVAKVELQGIQEEEIYVEYNNARLVELGLSPQRLAADLDSLNIISSGGSVRIGPERITLEPTGNIESVEELKKTVIQLPSGNGIVYLEDIANVYRDYVDPANQLARVNGEPAIIISISMTEGGNIVDLGAILDQEIPIIEATYPLGVKLEKLFFQPDYVNRDVSNFMGNLGQAVIIIVAVLLVFLGLRVGVLVATMVPMVIVLSFVIMSLFGITINQISLAALIIALGLLVDNAIVVAEGVTVKKEQGLDVKLAAIETCKELYVPLLISSLTTAAAFLPIFLAESAVGEYTADIFKVVSIALLISWVLAMTFLPLVTILFLRGQKQKAKKQEGEGFVARTYENLLKVALGNKLIFFAVIIALFYIALKGLALVPSVFIPPRTDAIINAEFNMPHGTDIQTTAKVIAELEQYFRDEHLVPLDADEPGIKSWVTFIGQGAPRYVLTVNPDPRNARLSQMVINTNSYLDIPEIVEATQNHFRIAQPDLEVKMKKLENGTPIDFPVEVRLSGKDIKNLDELAGKIRTQLINTPGVIDVVDDWGLRTKKLQVVIDQSRARRAGVTSDDVAVSLQAGLSGIELTEYREQDEVIPITLRSVSADREDLAKLDGMAIYSSSTGESVPLKQVADVSLAWEPSVIFRRDREKTITISAQLAPNVTAKEVNQIFQPWMEEEASSWQRGYSFEYGGEAETSGDANEAIVVKLPIAGMLILLLLVGQFNSMRKTTIILTTIPLGMIGVTAGLLIAKSTFGFMTILGVISLAGIIINNAIVLIDRIQIELEQGKAHGIAVIDAAKQRLRPILLTTATTVGGMLPLWINHDPMFESLAIAVIFGLVFATVLTLLFVPVLYSMFYRVKFS